MVAVEPSVSSLKGRILGRHRRQPVARKAEPHFARLFVEHGPGGELRQHAVVDAELLRLLARHRHAELLRQQRELAIVGEAVFEDRYACVACGQHVGAEAAENLSGNAPDRETEHQHHEKQLGDPGFGGVSEGIEHIFFRLPDVSLGNTVLPGRCRLLCARFLVGEPSLETEGREHAR